MNYANLTAILAILVASLPAPTPASGLHVVEACAGRHRLSSALLRHGYVVKALDVNYNKLADFNTALGLYLI